jgi:hypothetical protein
MMGCCCHADDTAGLFDPSTITSLMPLWLFVLIAEGEEPSIAFSFDPLASICC